MDFNKIQSNKPLEGEPQVVKQPELTDTEKEKITRVVEAMSKAEKIVAVRSIPTEILQNEVTRRIKRDKDKLKGFKELVESMEKY